MDWDKVRPIALMLAVTLPVVLILGRRRAALDLGDDATARLGARVEAVRWAW